MRELGGVFDMSIVYLVEGLGALGDQAGLFIPYRQDLLLEPRYLNIKLVQSWYLKHPIKCINLNELQARSFIGNLTAQQQFSTEE
jgi:hypothetical protein